MRERLIGAAAIVVVAIVAIPWLVSRARDAQRLNQMRVLPVPTSPGGTAPSPSLSLALPPLTGAPNSASTTSPPAPAKTVPAPAAPAPVSSSPPGVPDSGWGVQVASLTDPGAAATLSARLIHAGFKSFVTPHRVHGKTWYRVRVGPYPDAASAKAAAPEIAAVSGTKVIVRQLGGDG